MLAARDRRAHLFVYDVREPANADLQFVLGAQVFAGFRAIVITRKGQAVPDGFEAGVDCSDSAEHLVSTAREVTADVIRRPSPGHVPPPMFTAGVHLAPREFEASVMITQGYTNRQIADAMGVKKETVKKLVNDVLRKLQCEGRIQVAFRLSELGLKQS